MVHHSLEDADQLCDAILEHLASRFVVVRHLHSVPGSGWQPAAGSQKAKRHGGMECLLCSHSAHRLVLAAQYAPCTLTGDSFSWLQAEQLVGTRENGSTAACIVREVQLPQRARENGAAGAGANAAAAGEGEGADSSSEEEGDQGPVDPASIVYVVDWLSGPGGAPTGERSSLHLEQLQRPAEGSRLAALNKPLLRRWVETVATAEPVAVRGRDGRAMQACSRCTSLQAVP